MHVITLLSRLERALDCVTFLNAEVTNDELRPYEHVDKHVIIKELRELVVSTHNKTKNEAEKRKLTVLQEVLKRRFNETWDWDSPEELGRKIKLVELRDVYHWKKPFLNEENNPP